MGIVWMIDPMQGKFSSKRDGSGNHMSSLGGNPHDVSSHKYENDHRLDILYGFEVFVTRVIDHLRRKSHPMCRLRNCFFNGRKYGVAHVTFSPERRGTGENAEEQRNVPNLDWLAFSQITIEFLYHGMH